MEGYLNHRLKVQREKLLRANIYLCAFVVVAVVVTVFVDCFTFQQQCIQAI